MEWGEAEREAEWGRWSEYWIEGERIGGMDGRCGGETERGRVK